jgi:hypothetical protein
MKPALFVYPVILSMLAGTASAEIITFIVRMDGAQAAACMGTGSPATGTGFLRLDTDTGDVEYNLGYEGLSAPETVSHIHGAAAECVNAGVVAGLPLGESKIGTTNFTAQQQADLIGGRYYVNVHTTNFPAGEIRGQILRTAQAPAASTAGMAFLIVVLSTFVVLHIRQRERGAA